MQSRGKCNKKQSALTDVKAAGSLGGEKAGGESSRTLNRILAFLLVTSIAPLSSFSNAPKVKSPMFGLFTLAGGAEGI
jgi:hypothetical protein